MFFQVSSVNVDCPPGRQIKITKDALTGYVILRFYKRKVLCHLVYTYLYRPNSIVV